MELFSEIKGKLGFGGMRLPKEGENIDIDTVCQMVDLYIKNGFNYFDTAHGYHGGKSETAIKTALCDRYPRESFLLTDKLSDNFFESEEDIRPFFNKQLQWCGVEYFDFYLMHAQDHGNYPKYKRCKAYETAFALKAEGKIRHVGLSFHDKASLLRQILTDYPQIEVVQLQLNYLDFDDESVEGRKCVAVCREFQKPIIVMEPVKGGILANHLPPAAQEVFSALPGSAASYAIRFAAGIDGVVMVLSGMGTVEMVKENVSFMKEFTPLSETETAAVQTVRDIFQKENLVACTGCGYCAERCPKQLAIPGFFACLNAKDAFDNWNSRQYYRVQSERGKASECIGCGACEAACPQHLSIRSLLKTVAETFEKK